MKLKFYLLFIFYTLLFLFYPGDSYYFHLFAYNRELFNKKDIQVKAKINPVPYLKSPYYPKVTAEGIYVVDLPSFTPIFEKNAQEKFLPASTTKILTALVALVPDEKITVENLFYGVLVYSANDAAFALADNFGRENFMKKVNEKAKLLGMNNSNFKNPAGLDRPDQYSTPFDLTLASRELLKNPYLAKIVSTKEITISDVDFKYFHKLTNVNKLLGEIQGLGGLKTGYTEEAGENLVSFYKKNGHQFIIVILKSLDRFNDTKNIIRWVEENINYYSFTAGT
jgi:D-alanyl-D-alanine carboxypeptidase (penicillin-binding protein 5/6)